MRIRFFLLSVYVSSSFHPAMADTWFNPAFLSADPNAVASLKHFESVDNQLPGTYRVDIYMNQRFVESRDVEFITDKENGGDSGLIPAFTTQDWEALGINTTAYPAFQPQAVKNKEQQSETTEQTDRAPIAIATAIPMAVTQFDFSAQRLDISVPQAAVKTRARGYVSPELWDEGIPAILFNYNYSGSSSEDDDSGSDTTHFFGLNSGLNFGAWRLRNYTTWNKSDSSENVESVNSTLSRAIIPIKSQLVIGDSSTSGEVFDSVPFRGVQLMSDENMHPDSLQGYAPVVRGIAKGNATVTIKQNGYTIYQTHVSPGAFVIEDLYASSNSGDLDVEIEEADGSVSRYTVAYSTLPSLLREGRMEYATTVGKYRSGNDQQEEKSFVQGTLSRGLSHGMTVYGGTQLSSDYLSASVGLGLNMGEMGAVSLDATHANTTLADDSEHTGQSYRFQYAKSLSDYGTNVQIMSYRYSTSGYYSFAESTWEEMEGAVYEDEDGDNVEDTTPDMYYNLYYTKRGRLQANISQNLQNSASLYVSGSVQSYWNTDETDSYLQAGYSDSWEGVNYNISLSHNKSAWIDEADKTLALNISLPLNRWLTPGNGNMGETSNPVNLSLSSSMDDDGYSTSTVGLSGAALDDHNLSYSVQQGYRSQNGNGYTGNATAYYRGGHGNLNAGYNYSDGYRQLNYGASGGVLIHGNGVTLSQPLGETNVLVAAPGVEGVSVENGSGIRTDRRGYTVIPHVSNYRSNRVALDTNSLGDTVDLEEAVANVVPTRGAVVKAEFSALIGARTLMTLQFSGKPVPFGAVVSSTNGKSTGIVGEDGQVYLPGLSTEGELTAKWGEGASQNCNASWVLPANKENIAIVKTSATCS